MLRRAGRRTDAGRALGEALELARACGARLLQERADAELEVAGTRVQRAARRGADALSPSERRVVGLAIEGLSNRQIAEALFVTRKAVEWHLGNAYRKLEVRSRGELAGALGVARPVFVGSAGQRTPADEPHAATSSTSRRAWSGSQRSESTSCCARSSTAASSS